MFSTGGLLLRRNPLHPGDDPGGNRRGVRGRDRKRHCKPFQARIPPRFRRFSSTATSPSPGARMPITDKDNYCSGSSLLGSTMIHSDFRRMCAYFCAAIKALRFIDGAPFAVKMNFIGYLSYGGCAIRIRAGGIRNTL